MAGEDHEPATEAAPTAEETFALVGNEVRAGILRTLSDARGGEGSPPSLSFSELRSRVDADVRSSQFNYHLQQLVGQFVEKRADGNAQLVEDVVDREDGGYALRPEGTMLTRTIRARTTGDESVDRLAVDLDCYHCGTPVEATYRNSIFKMQCPDCEYLYEYDLVPPGVLDDDERTLLSQVGEHQRHVRLSFARGACPLCGNAVGVRFVPPSDTGYPRPDLREACINRACDHCGHRNYLRVGEALLRDPALISFCHERGLDVTTTPIWELEFAATDRFTTVRSTDPWEVALCVSLDGVSASGAERSSADRSSGRGPREGDALELVVDEDLSVVERDDP
ncbi:DUF7351 domain-containing protein [Halomicrococcus sp. SG-WS-1]|uniref:DUF7351 domain-containing protein n=1 Tax=Halomicrococcus sp. SG-WS-1 TaxID=3439057 RepID=UPI003F79F9C5